MSQKIVYKLLEWHRDNPRDLVWKSYGDAYTIWLSEIIMQQTRVAQGSQYFVRFKKAYPTVKDLAKAPLQKVLKLWEGLGYYSRARNLHATANWVCDELDGVFPTNYSTLIKLKGIGPYTAAAIASFSSNEAVAVVDGNVYRVLTRLFGVEEAIDQGYGKRIVSELANTLLPKKLAGEYNQAIMNFGALVCKPKPNCARCLLNENCMAFREDKVSLLPFKSKKLKIKKRYFLFSYLQDHDGNFAIEERVAKDVWQNLYQLPMIELSNEEDMANWKKHVVNADIDANVALLDVDLNQQLTHQKINAKFVGGYLSLGSQIPKNWIMVSAQEKEAYAFPKILNNFFEIILS